MKHQLLPKNDKDRFRSVVQWSGSSGKDPLLALCGARIVGCFSCLFTITTEWCALEVLVLSELKPFEQYVLSIWIYGKLLILLFGFMYVI